ncbi:MAG: TM2 domain-containing protein [Vitreimonas sp.]
MALGAGELIFIEQRVANEAKSTAAAYLLWLFLGWVSAHRFYLGKPVTAILQIVSYFFVVGFIWWLIDAILIPRIVEDDKDDLRTDLLLRFSVAAAMQPKAA